MASKRAIATLVTDTDSVGPGERFRAALRLRLAPGWHTYWKNPGDAGAAPELVLTPPAAGPIDWPVPHRLAEGSVMTYAYTNEVLLPVAVTANPGGGASLRAEANWLVCKDVCVPEEGVFVLELAAGPAAPSLEARLFAAHDRAVPRPSPWKTTISASGALSVVGPELGSATVAEAWFIPAEPGRIQNDAIQTLSVHDGGFVLGLTPVKGAASDAPLAGIVSIRDRAGQQIDVSVAAQPGEPPLATAMGLPAALLFAFLGGLILNLMPCVFPVLAMKAIGLARGLASGAARGHALSYTAGVLVTFAALGGALLAARSAGSAAGWGFQFQSPVFVAGMAWLLFGVGLNLSGVFQVGGGLTSAGGALASRGGHVGSFFTGLLAVLVATPCTAPFMGAAIAAGLAAPPAVTMLVFLTLGLGLAAPTVALAFLPGASRFAPRPGRWMDILKQALAFPMYGATVWLVWVIGQTAGPAGVLATGVGLLLCGFAAWVVGVAQATEGRGRRVGQAAAIAAILAAATILNGIEPGPANRTDLATEAFTPANLAALRAEGRPVFVNMTASWCVTCLVNERIAISSEAVQQAFASRKVAYLKGDWTRQDPAITAFLRENGRDGVPLYVYYGPNGGAPITLPQFLTEGIILSVLAGP